MRERHKILFPINNSEELDQDEAFFYIEENNEKKKLRFHDYDEIYKRPGLYEELFYERLKCQSPKFVTESLKYAVEQTRSSLSELRVLDFGAGNGIMGEELKKHGVSRLVGLDIIDEAHEATERDRPYVYDAYYVADLSDKNNEFFDEVGAWQFDCVTTIAALGFGDVPPIAFLNVLNLLKEESWVAFNIKETFLDRSDKSGFSRTIRELILSEYFDLYHLERYKHRNSLEGKPLYYFAVICKKIYDIPDDFLEKLQLSEC